MMLSVFHGASNRTELKRSQNNDREHMRVILAEELLEVYKCDLLTLGEAGRRRQTLSASWIAWLKFFMSICSSARCARKLAIEDAMGEKRRENE